MPVSHFLFHHIFFFLSILSFLLFSVSMRNAPWCEIDIPGGANIWGELYVAHEGGNISSGSRRCEILMRTFSVETHLHILQLRSIPDARLDALCVFRHTSFLFSADLWIAFLRRELNTYSSLNGQGVEDPKASFFFFFHSKFLKYDKKFALYNTKRMKIRKSRFKLQLLY